MTHIPPTTGAESALPPDRSAIATEHRNPDSMGLHTMSVRECIALINEEDRRVPETIRRASPEIKALIEAAEPGFLAGGRIIYIGAGTSGRLGVLDAAEAPPTFQVEHGRVVGVIAGGKGALTRSSESMEDDPDGAADELDGLELDDRDLLLGIAAGGTTPYVLGALRLAKDRPSAPVTGLLTCTAMVKPMEADHLIVLETGPEVLTGSTRMKGGSATKMTLNIISTTLMVREGRVYENLMVDVRATNDKLKDRAARIVTQLTGLARDDAFGLIERAGKSVKTAIVMHRLGLDRTQAEGRISACGGRLGEILDSKETR